MTWRQSLVARHSASGQGSWCRGAIAPALLAVALTLSGCGSGATPILPPGGPGTAEASSAGEEEWALRVLDLTNSIRAEHGLTPLALDPTASLAAYEHCWDMDLRGYFDHVNPDGEVPVERLARHGVERPWVGENLARGQATPEEVVQAWIDSPPHRENILYPGWTRVGIAVHSGPAAGPWWAAEYFD